jgi:hypothetical protein
MVPFPQVVGVHLGDDLPHFFVDYVLDFGFLGFPFSGDDAEVMVEGGEEGSVAVVVVVEEGAHHGSLVVVVCCSLAGQCHPHLGCFVSGVCFVVCADVGMGVLQFLGV